MQSKILKGFSYLVVTLIALTSLNVSSSEAGSNTNIQNLSKHEKWEQYRALGGIPQNEINEFAEYVLTHSGHRNDDIKAFLSNRLLDFAFKGKRLQDGSSILIVPNTPEFLADAILHRFDSYLNPQKNPFYSPSLQKNPTSDSPKLIANKFYRVSSTQGGSRDIAYIGLQKASSPSIIETNDQYYTDSRYNPGDKFIFTTNSFGFDASLFKNRTVAEIK